MSWPSKRFWVAVALGGIVGGGVVAGFAPYVRSKIHDKARRYGASVDVARVLPTPSGVRLDGVRVSLAEVPGVEIRLPSVTLPWSGARPSELRGGRVTALGSLDGLAAAALRWRDKHLASSRPGGGGGTTLSLAGFDVEWRSGAGPGAVRVSATGFGVQRGAGKVTVQARTVDARLRQAAVKVEDGRVVLAVSGGDIQIKELASSALHLEYGSRGDELGSRGAGGAASSSPAASAAPARPPASVASRPAPGNGPAVTSNGQAAELPASPVQVAHHRVRVARQLRGWLLEAARRLDAVVARDAVFGLRRATARLAWRDQMLNLGPGTFSLRRDGESLVLALSPDLAAEQQRERSGGARSLTFTLELPLRDRSAKPVAAELRGGPVWLSTLGVRDGDMGLEDVGSASIESDARVVLSPDGQSVRLSGTGKLRGLALQNPKLAPERIEGLVLAFRGEAEARLDGSEVTLKGVEVNVGHVQVILDGHYRRSPAGGHALDLRYQVPLVTCQRVFESIPAALVPKLGGMRFVGSLAAKGHARFDTAALPKSYDVDWDGSLSCRVIEAPPALRPQSFRGSFRKVVYTPEGKQEWMTFGPDTGTWATAAGISRFMTAGVLTCEDGHFFRHHGFDKEAIVNSLRENLIAGRFVRGASTVSMQLAKNLYLAREKTLSRKLQEAILTLYLEQELTKREMMEVYLNIIEFGPMVYGIGPAARHYFHTSAANLSLGQAMYLAHILRNPKKQYFGAGGAVIPGRMKYLQRLMKIANKIGQVSDEELEVGLRETVIFGSASMIAPPDDDIYGEEPPGGAAPPDPDGPSGPN